MEPPGGSNRPPNKNAFFVGWLSFFGGISQDIFSPILPIYLTSVLGLSKSFVGVAEGVVAASVYISKVAAGFFSDKFKKQKPIIFLGYFLSMIGRPLLAFVTSGASVLGLRLLDGVGKGVKDPAKDVLIAGSTGRENRGKSFGIARMLDTLGSVAGPLILFGLLQLFKNSNGLYHYILLFSAVPLVVTLVILLLKVKEAPAPEAKEEIIARPPEKLSSSFYLFLAIAVLFALGNSSDAFLILRAQSLGISLWVIPLVIALFNLVYALAAVPFGALSDRIGRIPTMLVGWSAFMLVYLGFGLASGAVAVWFLYILYGIYYAANEGVAKAFLADIVGSGHRGRAFGIYGMSIGVAALPASFFAGFLWDKFGPQAPFYFGAGMAGLSAILLLVFSKKLKVVGEVPRM
ncbi:MAG: MFS transporter [Candidatus Liptonbacteria bacterium]|nr:MFS transporter [Candidatus Liptonbacteria bacterium]